MIAFENQRIDSRQDIDDVSRDVPDIGQKAKAPRAIRKNELDRLPRIMGNGKRLHVERSYPERLETIDDPQIHTIGDSAASDISSVTQPYRQAVAPGKRKDAAHMIPVFVGHQNPGNIIRLPIQAGETAERLALPEAAIDHQTGGIAFDQQGITRAAATQRCKPDHCNC